MASLGRVSELTGELRNRAFRRLWLGQVASEIGDWTARLALATLVYARTGSSTESALVLVCSLLPMLGPGQLLGSLADRFDRRLVMITADIARAVVFGLLAASIVLPISVLLGACLVAGLATAPYEAARAAAILDVTPEERLPAALSLGQATQSLALVAGWAVGGVLLALTGPAVALAINAGSFLVSAALVAGLPPLRSAREETGEEGGAASGTGRLREAARVVVGDVLVRRAAAIAILAVAPATAIETLVVPHVTRTWGAEPGISSAVLAAGALLSLLLTIAVPSSLAAEKLIRIAAVLAAVPAAAAALLFASGNAGLVAAGFVASAGAFTALAPAAAALGPRLPQRLRASSYALLGSTLTATQLALSTAAGLIADATTPAVAATVLTLLPMVGGTLALRRSLGTVGRIAEPAAAPAEQAA